MCSSYKMRIIYTKFLASPPYMSLIARHWFYTQLPTNIRKSFTSHYCCNQLLFRVLQMVAPVGFEPTWLIYQPDVFKTSAYTKLRQGAIKWWARRDFNPHVRLRTPILETGAFSRFRHSPKFLEHGERIELSHTAICSRGPSRLGYPCSTVTQHVSNMLEGLI